MYFSGMVVENTVKALEKFKKNLQIMSELLLPAGKPKRT